MILHEFHEGIGGGHFVVDIIAKKILDVGYWWPKLFHDAFEFCKSCDACQKARGLTMQNLGKLVNFTKGTIYKMGIIFVGLIKLVK
jgi:hypothetical protein